MTNSRLVAYALIAIGIVALLSRLTGDAGWLWVGLVAAGFLVAYQRERVYAFLVLGSILMGVAVGILLEGTWHWPGTFLVSLGAGVAAIDLAAPRDSRWPRIVGIGLIGLGVITGLAETGILTSSAFAVLLIAAGVVLVVMARRRATPADAASSQGSQDEPVQPTPPVEAGPADAAQGATLRSGDTTPPGAPRTGAKVDDGLRAALLAWRRNTAEAEGRSEALVLNDETLDALLTRRPASLEELAEVRGIGPVKLERYGQDLLGCLRSGPSDAEPRS